MSRVSIRSLPFLNVPPPPWLSQVSCAVHPLDMQDHLWVALVPEEAEILTAGADVINAVEQADVVQRR